ncbi:MAG: hypothetical protein BMS9Abin12_0771 [Acidimicrobiia bacterium]|nr:MAG: hypothetical protein BMS9Abin12_0771 [Acidimicrobiia bacterium]
MASEKRERQRANRDQKLAVEHKGDVRKQRIAIIKRYATYTLIFGAAIIALKLLAG